MRLEFCSLCKLLNRVTDIRFLSTFLLLHLLHDDYKETSKLYLKEVPKPFVNNNINMVDVCESTIKSQNLIFLFFSIYILCVCFCIHACICIESPPSRGLEIIALGTRSLLLVIHYWVRSTPHDWPAYTSVFVFIHTAVLVLAVNIIGLNSIRLPCI